MGDEVGGTRTSAAASSSASAMMDDNKRSCLLRRITEEGGFAFVSSAEKAATGDLRAAEAAREMSWEQLHSGPWQEVVPAWRDAYAMACLDVAAIRAAAGDRREALQALDMGVIMGGPLLRAELHAAVREIMSTQEAYAADPSLCSGDAPEGCDGPPPLGNDEFASVIRVLPSRSLSCKKVEKRCSLSLESFIVDYFLRNRPVIIGDHIRDWPAVKKWKDVNYLKKVAGDRTVPVEVGKNYLSSDWKQELITFSEFLQRIRSSEIATNLTYLAQHPLFDQIEDLRNDIMVPDYCFAGGGELQSLNAWFGPPGTVTPLHHDPHHNLFAQVVGKKYVRLYPSTVSDDLYPYSEKMLSNSSQVDLDNMDRLNYPRAEDLEFFDCVLEEGELLYIPPRWWHYVRSLTTSFSVSFWWSSDVAPATANHPGEI